MLHPKLELGPKGPLSLGTVPELASSKKAGKCESPACTPHPRVGASARHQWHLVNTRKLPRNGRLLSSQHPWKGSEKK